MTQREIASRLIASIMDLAAREESAGGCLAPDFLGYPISDLETLLLDVCGVPPDTKEQDDSLGNFCYEFRELDEQDGSPSGERLSPDEAADYILKNWGRSDS